MKHIRLIVEVDGEELVKQFVMEDPLDRSEEEWGEKVVEMFNTLQEAEQAKF